MFNKPIHSTMLTSEAAGRLFSNITAAGSLDATFLSTLRILLHKRLPKEDAVRLSCKCLHISDSELLREPSSQQLDILIPETVRGLPSSGHSIHILCTYQSDVGNSALNILRAQANAIKHILPGYHRREDLQIFFARKAKSLFYTDDAGKNTIIFTGKMDLKHFHVLQMMIPKYLPFLFEGANKPLTEKEISLLKSLGNKSAVEYERLLEEFAKDIDIRQEIIRSKLSGFESQFERLRINEIKNELKACQTEYDNYLANMQDVTNRIQERQYVLAGLECSINSESGDSELMEYFMCNKNLTITQVSGTTIGFIAHGYADVYDIEAFEQYVSNHRGYMYSSLSPAVTKVQMERLYRALFGSGIYKLRMCAAYRADMRTGLRAFQNYSFPSESQTYLPNPHIQGFGCIGTYAGRFQEYMRNKDYVGAIDQAVVSARNINFYDSSVIPTFGNTLSRATIQCIEKPNGTLLTPQEAIKELERSD